MAYESFSRQMSDVSSSFVELMYEANKRGNLPGWPETHKLQSFRSEYNSWVRNHGMRLDSWTHNTAPNDLNEDRIKRSAIRLALSTLVSQVQLLMQDYRDGPEPGGYPTWGEDSLPQRYISSIISMAMCK
nr:hypothetical protein FVER53263_08954 [Fusarium verticillioides]